MVSVDAWASLLASGTATPIAQLNPDLADQASRVVRGEVTITWPYNRVKNTIAFLLAEPDVRLRRAKGQVRIELHGPSAKAIADCGLGGGDEVLFSLDSVEYAKDESPGRIPGARLDWQLQFTNKLILQAKLGDSNEPKYFNIDHPQPEPTVAIETEPQPVAIDIELGAFDDEPAIRKVPDFPANEYPSPAFIKRARISYGALFEGGLDIFEEDGGVPGKGRKKTRFGLDSSAWRYTSQSPSPEPASPVPDAIEEHLAEEIQSSPSPKPHMTDEGCQTIELEVSPVAPEPTEATTLKGAPQEISLSPPERREEQPTLQASDATGNAGEMMPESSPKPAAVVQETPNTLFGTPRAAAPSFSMFGTTTPTRVGTGVSLADQVRFGFSHIPQPTQSFAMPDTHPVEVSESHKSQDYPESYLDTPGPAKFADMTSFLGIAAEHNPEMESVHDNGMIPETSTVDQFVHGTWDVATQSPNYNQMEGGHFGMDALNEETRITAEAPLIHSDDIAPEKIPEGFSSYGNQIGGVVVDDKIEEQHPTHSPQYEDPLRQEEPAEESSSESKVGVEENDEVAYDELGERLEEGDYDQRNYNVPADDDEGVSDEDDEIEQEAEDRYGEGDLFGEEEDGYGEEWEEEDEYESEEEEEGDDFPSEPERRPAAEIAKPPVVISLLSDSEDDDEPPSAPKKTEAPLGASQQEALSTQPLAKERDENMSKVIDPMLAEAAAMAHAENMGRAAQNTDATNMSQAQVQVVDIAAGPNKRAQQQDSPHATKPVEPSNPVGDSDNHNPQNVPQEANNDAEFEASSESESEPDNVVEQFSSDGSLFGEKSEADDIDVEDENMEDEEVYSSDEDKENVKQDAPVSYEYEPNDDGDSEDGNVEIEEAGVEDVRGADEIENVKEVEVEEAEEEDATGDDVDMVETFDDLMDIDNEKPSKDENMTREGTPSKSDEPRNSVTPIPEEEQDAVGDDDTEMVDAGAPAVETLPQEPQPVSDPDRQATEDTTVRLETPRQSSSPEDRVSSDFKLAGHHEQPSPVSVFKHHERKTAGVVEPATTTHQSGESRALPSSPPTTQSFETQVLDDFTPPVATLASSRPTSKQENNTRQLPTPMESQVTVGMVSQTMVVEYEEVEYEEIEASATVETSSPDHISHEMSEAEAGFEPLPSQAESEIADESFVEQSSEDSGKTPAESLPEDGGPYDKDEGADEIEEARSPKKPDDTVEIETLDDDITTDSIVSSQAQAGVDDPRLEDHTTISVSASVDMDKIREDDEHLVPSGQSRRSRKRSRPSSGFAKEPIEDEITVQTRRTRSHDVSSVLGRPETDAPDISVHLARQAVAAKRPKKAPEPLRTSPRMITRARSSSLQMSATPEVDEDTSVSLAKAALASPSKSTSGLDCTTSSLKSELTKRLRSDFRECVTLKSLRNHVEKFPNVVAIVTTQPPPPTRAKGGPREYMLSFHVTDPSVAPTQVVEVQLHRPHKESLPIVNPGDAILLQRFQVKALSKKGFGLRSHSDSAWAVFDTDEGPPQIKGPPIEDYAVYGDYMDVLRAWFRSLDGGAKGKLARANKKFEELSVGK
ncbi:hypothetical protein B0T25DRAFT_106930 [Lasiosphaeria hispida]|uniref:Telomeric single stranded DNA binding POT1/Cdc13 domain-containing protein n=1 Tax=Lasiosphaeria hispida TaxID=260671 RepID=A0AAJ0MHW6_9PEZI|nr:hypothetical protein B0T25DRAFT_106930 [Lasiosphaeria hispida]